jgi:hypothetical protein
VPKLTRSWRRSLGFGLGLCLALLAVMSPALNAPKFWDDDPKVFQHDGVARPDGLARLWLRGGLRHEEWPITQSLFWVQHRLWGETFWAYRGVNALLHALNAVLLARLLTLLRLRGARTVAAIWALHPVQMETVIWITEFKTLVAWTFTLLAWSAWRTGGRGGQAASVALWALACGAKTAFVGLPVVWPWVGWARTGRLDGAEVRRILPHLGLGLLAAGWTMHVSAGIVHPAAFLGPEGAERFAAAGRAWFFYWDKAIRPWGLALIYPHAVPEIRATGALALLPLALLGALAVALFAARRHRLARVALVIGVAQGTLLAPVSGLFDMPFMMHALVADHFQYAFLAGTLLLIGCGWRAARRGRERRLSPVAPRVAAGLLLVLLAALSARRAHALGDTRRMWQDTLARNPLAWAAYNNLGAHIVADGLKLYEEAALLSQDVQSLERRHLEALLAQPDQAERLARDLAARRDLAAARRAEGAAILQEAVPYLERAIALQPGNEGGRHALANARLRLNQPEAAERLYREAIAIDARKREEARNPALLLNYAALLRRQNRREEAVALTQEALRLRPRLRAAREMAEALGLPLPETSP